MKKLYIAVLLIAVSLAAPAQINVVKNLYMYNYIGIVNGKMLFFAADITDPYDIEIWSSDGTTGGTQLVKDIFPGAGGSILDQNSWNMGSNSFTPYIYKNELYFIASDGIHDNEVWKSDGTAAGTVVLIPNTLHYTDFRPPYFAELNGILYFTAKDAGHGYELWKTDGTAAGTVMVKDIWSGYFGSIPSHLFTWNGSLYFTATDETYGVELFKSDGTAAGTQVFKDIIPGVAGAFDDGYGESINPHFTASGNYLYFTAETDTDSFDATTFLYRTDGTANGTFVLNNSLKFPDQLIDLNGTLYFYCDDSSNPSVFYKSDGTPAGTVNVPTNNQLLMESSYFVFDNELYCNGASNNLQQNGLCKSDGTTGGSSLIYQLQAAASTPYVSNFLDDAGSNTFFFIALTNVGGSSMDSRIGESNGNGSTRLYYGAAPYPAMVLYNDKVYFYGRDSIGNSNSLGLYELPPSSVGVNEISGAENFAVYPNPADQFIVCSLKLRDLGEKEISLFDLSGRKVLSGKVAASEDKITINVSDLPEGMYLLKIEAGNLTGTEKISVMH